MKNRLMISALLFCSSLSYAGEATTPPPADTRTKKPSKVKKAMPRPSTERGLQQKGEQTGLGELGTRPQKSAAPQK